LRLVVGYDIISAMTASPGTTVSGFVASLHLHSPIPDGPLQTVDAFELVANKGIAGNVRYFGRTSSSSGKPWRRHVSLIAREQLAEHAATLGLGGIVPGAVRSNIETRGIDLLELLGLQVTIGEAVLHFYEGRTPCQKMDAICVGLRQLMENNRQGVVAEIISSGRIRVGDTISAVRPQATHLSG
jgi:hypothetical protein